jgi:hypothetical protein
VLYLQIPGVREVLEGLLPYTQRHFGRIDRLNRSAFLLDFILSSMNSLIPSENRQDLGDKVIGAWETLPQITAGDTDTASLEGASLENAEAVSSQEPLEEEVELDKANGFHEEPEIPSVSTPKKSKKSKRKESLHGDTALQKSGKKKKSKNST